MHNDDWVGASVSRHQFDRAANHCKIVKAHKNSCLADIGVRKFKFNIAQKVVSTILSWTSRRLGQYSPKNMRVM